MTLRRITLRIFIQLESRQQRSLLLHSRTVVHFRLIKHVSIQVLFFEAAAAAAAATSDKIISYPKALGV